MVGGIITSANAAFREAGASGDLRVVALNYFSLGEEHTEESLHTFGLITGSPATTLR
jgi:hypothetical protein